MIQAWDDYRNCLKSGDATIILITRRVGCMRHRNVAKTPQNHYEKSTNDRLADWSSQSYGAFECARIWLKSTKSGPVGFEKMDFSHFSPCSMQWMFQTPGVSNVHVQKTVSYNIYLLFSFRVVGPQSWVLRVTKLSCFLRYPHDTSHLLYFFMYK